MMPPEAFVVPAVRMVRRPVILRAVAPLMRSESIVTAPLVNPAPVISMLRAAVKAVAVVAKSASTP